MVKTHNLAPAQPTFPSLSLTLHLSLGSSLTTPLDTLDWPLCFCIQAIPTADPPSHSFPTGKLPTLIGHMLPVKSSPTLLGFLASSVVAS